MFGGAVGAHAAMDRRGGQRLSMHRSGGRGLPLARPARRATSWRAIVAPVKLAVVIPALDEADRIAGAVASAAAGRVEVVVVDGGSRDGTRDRGRRRGLGSSTALPDAPASSRPEPGRARARPACSCTRTRGSPPGFAAAVREALRDPAVVGGAFRLRFDQRDAGPALDRVGRAPARRPVRAAVRRSGALRPPRVLEAIGGIPQSRRSWRISIWCAPSKPRTARHRCPCPATTSARRYARTACVRTHGARTGSRPARWALGVDRGAHRRAGSADERGRRPAGSRRRRPAIALRRLCGLPAPQPRLLRGLAGRRPSPTWRRFVAIPRLVGWAIGRRRRGPRRARDRPGAALARCSSRLARAVVRFFSRTARLQRGPRDRVRDAQRSLRPSPAAAPVLLLPLADRRPHEPLRQRPQRGAPAAGLGLLTIVQTPILFAAVIAHDADASTSSSRLLVLLPYPLFILIARSLRPRGCTAGASRPRRGWPSSRTSCRRRSPASPSSRPTRWKASGRALRGAPTQRALPQPARLVHW